MEGISVFTLIPIGVFHLPYVLPRTLTQGCPWPWVLFWTFLFSPDKPPAWLGVYQTLIKERHLEGRTLIGVKYSFKSFVSWIDTLIDIDARIQSFKPLQQS